MKVKARMLGYPLPDIGMGVRSIVIDDQMQIQSGWGSPVNHP
jgi:hypothetical protein